VANPKLKLVSVSSAVTYRFEPAPEDKENRDFGWALCTVNDTTGELSIQSDWGNWSHRWSANPNHLGAPTLTHFISNRSSAHYLANKLSRESGPRSGEEFDVDATIARFRRDLAERRLEEGRDGENRRKGYAGSPFDGKPLTCELAREIWDELGSLAECGRSADLFCERFFRIDGYAWVTEEPWERTIYSPTPAYKVLLGSILPALIEACRARVQSQVVVPEHAEVRP
jgi:hypothetical protein